MKRFIFMAVLALITLSTRAQTDSLEVYKPKYSVRPGLITENEKKETENKMEEIKTTEAVEEEAVKEYEPLEPTCAFDDFVKVDMRVAKVLECETVTKSKKLLRFKLDLGFETRQVFSGIAK